MIKGFNQYLMESEGTLTQKQKNWLDRRTSGTWRVNPSTGLVDVNGSFNCSNYGIKTLQGVRFGRVSGNFSCSDNQLTSLEGAPQEVGDAFGCDGNQLTSLEGAPQKVGGIFSCTHNKLTSLEGAPQEVVDDFTCTHNKLTSLEGAPEEVGGSFICYINQLTSLEGAPQKVGRSLDCFNNQLTSLKGIPFVNRNIYLDPNPIWKLIFPYWNHIGSMDTLSRNLVLQMIGQLENPTVEDIARIVRSVERMDML